MEERREPGLLLDLYELTMAQSYFQNGMTGPATFSLFIRRYPRNRSYFVAAGLEDALAFLESFSFSPRALEYLQGTGLFTTDFLDYLSHLRFTGEVWAVPEGRVFFINEPVLEVTAPLIEAQVAETVLINQINFQTLVATKAARCVWASGGRPVIDFGFRRAHGIEAGLKAARACYIAGFQATSNVQAGHLYGIPVVGTMAHSYITAFEEEIEAFRAFARTYPERTILLIDTYDTVAGARKAVEVAREMRAQGHDLRGVRLDSGDLEALSREVRRLLDQEGFPQVRIVASGGLDEYEIDALVRQGAPIDLFAVGTRVLVADDAPWSDMAYKLVQYQERPLLKLSPGKATLPGQKQVFRFTGPDGLFREDVIALRGEALEGGEPLLVKVMEGGKRLGPPPPLQEVRERFQADFTRLPGPVKALVDPARYPVRLSPGLEALSRDLQQALILSETGGRGRGED